MSANGMVCCRLKIKGDPITFFFLKGVNGETIIEDFFLLLHSLFSFYSFSKLQLLRVTSPLKSLTETIKCSETNDQAYKFRTTTNFGRMETIGKQLIPNKA